MVVSGCNTNLDRLYVKKVRSRSVHSCETSENHVGRIETKLILFYLFMQRCKKYLGWLKTYMFEMVAQIYSLSII